MLLILDEWKACWLGDIYLHDTMIKQVRVRLNLRW